MRPEIQPFRPAVYDSRQQPGRDEIYLSIQYRVARSDGELVRQLRARVKILGTAEDQWRAPHDPAAG